MWFWIRHVILGMILIIAAYIMLNTQDFVFNVDSSNSGTSKFSTQQNAAAKGLSDFYAKIRDAVDTNRPSGNKFVVYNELPEETMTDTLQKRRLVVRPSPRDWKGEAKERNFSKGDTLKNQLSNFAREEGIELYWYLKRDYVVKHFMNVESDFVVALYKVAEAIDGDFQGKVIAYYCPNERAAIITDKADTYVAQNCISSLEQLRPQRKAR